MLESATARVKQAFARLHSTEPKVHAFVRTLEHQALDEAQQLDNLTSRGPLHGVPFAVKEVFDVAGVETTGGCRALAGRIADADAVAVERLRGAGAVLMGTQVSHELTCGLDEPPTRNPWNLACYPGGSSAGSGVSVAVGSAWVALGTDAAGSVRIPAAMTGVVGFKPSTGAISKRGVMRDASAPSIDNVGIVAKNVGLAANVFDAIAFADPGDAQTLKRRPYPTEADAGLHSGLCGLRIAVLGERTVATLDRLYEREVDVRLAFRGACDSLRAAGAELVQIELPTLAQSGAAVVTFFSQELAFAHRSRLCNKDAGYHPLIRDMLAAAVASAPSALEDAVAVRRRLLTEIEAAMEQAAAQILLTPTTPRVAMPLATFQPASDLGSLIPYTCGFNLTGHPAISLPNGFDRQGLPVGLQIVGRRFHDMTLLRIALAIERLNLGQPGKTAGIWTSG